MPRSRQADRLEQAEEQAQTRGSLRQMKEYMGPERPIRWQPVGTYYLNCLKIDVRDFALEAYHQERRNRAASG